MVLHHGWGYLLTHPGIFLYQNGSAVGTCKSKSCNSKFHYFMSDWSYAQYMLSMLHHGWGNSFFDIHYESIDTFISCLKKLSCLDDYKSPNCAIQIAGQKKGKKSNQNRARGTSTWPKENIM